MAKKKAVRKKSISSDPPRVNFHLVKSPEFRSVHVEGMYGGISPHGYINGAVYTERGALPQLIVHAVDDRGVLGKELKDERAGKTGIVRELQVNLVMDEKVARGVAKWLNERADELKRLREEAPISKETDDASTTKKPSKKRAIKKMPRKKSE